MTYLTAFARSAARSFGTLAGLWLALWLIGWDDDVARLLEAAAAWAEEAGDARP